MFQINADIFPFLQELAQNNHRDWLALNRDRYREIQNSLYEFLENLLVSLGSADPSFISLNPKKCLFRLQRDARFARPGQGHYKLHCGMHLISGGDKASCLQAGFYIHLEPNACRLAGGAYQPIPSWLKRIREHLANDGQSFTTLVKGDRFRRVFGEVRGESLKRAPLGFPADHPHIQWLKKKTLTVVHEFPDHLALQDDFVETCRDIFKVYQPFRDFLNRP
ncbi:MAG: DUF2461 domain-containing protein [Gammaproteobacteria bacterium]|nr:DUF2461 domain-containing protein [Gammaproteobacteria bacterium]